MAYIPKILKYCNLNNKENTKSLYDFTHMESNEQNELTCKVETDSEIENRLTAVRSGWWDSWVGVCMWSE